MAGTNAKWHRELTIFSKVKSLLILEGNVLDQYHYDAGNGGPSKICKLQEYLNQYFFDAGYENVVFFDHIQGYYNDCAGAEDNIDRFAKLVNVAPGPDDRIAAKFKTGAQNGAAGIAKAALAQSNVPTVIIMDFASRYIPAPDSLQQEEVDGFTVLQQAALGALEAVKADGTKLQNLLVLVTNKVNDLPAWFYLQNPCVKTIMLSYPTKEERADFVKGQYFKAFFNKDIFNQQYPYFEEHSDELERIQDRFVALTEGFSFAELNSLRKLCKNEKIDISDMCDVIDLYKYGIKDNPWKSAELTDKIKNGKEQFEKRVKGQDYALVKTLDVIKRAVTGMSGMQGSSQGRPKGVLFFAGPTGTGKTETAKTLAEMIFGDESCCIRFDMSEYSQSHSDQKLLGAPPGYVGYEAGGQLTNAVKKNPFSILLFDEIEKAHPSIFDKFLQILEDGRMTDGQGNTVYFSETIIIFTSNLGIYVRDENGNRVENVDRNMPYPQISDRVRGAIEDYFKLTLGRPEILNRIGENIVVFNYIQPDVAKLILNSQVNKIFKNLQTEKHISVSLSEEANETLIAHALNNLDNGGRGIGNVVENLLINPWSRFLFDNGIYEKKGIVIDRINADAFPPEIECTIGEEK